MLARLLPGCALAVWVLSSAARCAAQPIRELGFDPRRDLALSGSLLALNLVAELAWPAPDEPRWTRVSDFDLRAASALGAGQEQRIGRSADALLGVALVAGPALAFFGPRWGADGAWPRRGFEDLVIFAEATLSAGLAAQVVKKSAARRRPAIYFDAREDDSDLAVEQSLRDRQRNTSFYSGHASVTASIGAALVTLSYLRGYRYRHAAAALFGVLSLAAGSLRVVGRWHWASDVLAGWAIGAAFGAGVPLLHELVHRRRKARGARASQPRVRVGSGPDLQLSWTF